MLNEKVPLIATYEYRNLIDHLATEIRKYLELNSTNTDLHKALYSLDARYTNQLRPRFQEMLRDVIHNYLLGQSSTSFQNKPIYAHTLAQEI